ncbi:tRNA pseudouridine(55) synthase TruB [Clostridium sp. NSJ-49]|jgi:tRNA pseudouridine55 synthase|uniref:tRNA pseudouridine synthase B n=1 Tax=Clostridium disporicum TaxID=84024 RepID=A0A173Y0B6_9CLOT|nr:MULTISPECIES: tRNA pseudouridine(55) synthase TruB [Clostridium]MBC5625598.1 tRNA pseudouridine(55) synthase TruB [Clostridium sp. NSJ-49]MDU6339750.1 tRNA pseudouridine(55) synthase TruB [Clostridium sp.]CUN57103.1 tRNA pseudouridine synthase B [Clostridium disporicum]
MNGVLNIFKPKGMTSFDVVREVKKVCKIKKVGHTGTLDPEATGVLPVCIGKATKIIDYIMDSEKIYEVTFKLGLKTTTYDLEGEILEERDSSFLKYEEILNAINSFKGEYCQVPPMYSALKQNGVRLYELARKGIEVERPGRNITIYNIEDIKIDNPYISMKVTCSKGTYIRSLCYDIGEKLGVYAAMTELCRVKTSRFLIENSVNINELTKDNLTQNLISIEEALNEFDKIVVNNKFAKLLVNGVNVFDSRVANEKLIANKLYRVYDENNNLLGIGSKNNNGFKIEKLLIT